MVSTQMYLGMAVRMCVESFLQKTGFFNIAHEQTIVRQRKVN